MIKTKTVLILGAGASAHLGYPVGIELVKNIIQSVEDKSGILHHYLAELEFTDDQIRDFRIKLDGSGVATIDAFMQRQKDYRDIAKTSIAAWLACQEGAAAVSRRDSNWYIGLWQAMDSALERLADNQLTIVTYNYDRSIDQFLYNAVDNLYPEGGPGDKLAAFRSIGIVHLHGKLGKLPWEAREGRPYGVNPDISQMREAADGIKVVYDADPTSQEFREAHRALAEADAVFFLGFGYDQTNLSRLKFDALKRGVHYYGTAYDLNDIRKNAVRQLIEALAKTPPPGFPGWQLQFGAYGEKIETFLPDRLSQYTT